LEKVDPGTEMGGEGAKERKRKRGMKTCVM